MIGVDQAARMPLGQRDLARLAPQRVAGDVGRDHRLAPEGGGAAGPGLGPDDQAVGLVQAHIDQTGGGGHGQRLGAVVEQQDGAAGAGGLGLDHLGQGVQGLHQGGVAGDQVEHLGLAGQLALGPRALGDVPAVEHHPADGRVVEQVVGQGLDVAPGPSAARNRNLNPALWASPARCSPKRARTSPASSGWISSNTFCRRGRPRGSRASAGRPGWRR